MLCGLAAAFCLGNAVVGESHLMWQLQQRPDKGPHSDRYHKVRGGGALGERQPAVPAGLFTFVSKRGGGVAAGYTRRPTARERPGGSVFTGVAGGRALRGARAREPALGREGVLRGRKGPCCARARCHADTPLTPTCAQAVLASCPLPPVRPSMLRVPCLPPPSLIDRVCMCAATERSGRVHLVARHQPAAAGRPGLPRPGTISRQLQRRRGDPILAALGGCPAAGHAQAWHARAQGARWRSQGRFSGGRGG